MYFTVLLLHTVRPRAFRPQPLSCPYDERPARITTSRRAILPGGATAARTPATGQANG
jgi:hypothetical protein